jgi:hypothetical protein
VAREGNRPSWAENEGDTDDPSEIRRRAEENAQVWEEVAFADATGHARERTPD